MTLTLNVDEFQSLRELIEHECGIRVDDNKMYLIESRLAKMVLESGCQSYSDFYRQAKDPAGIKLRNQIVDAMTTNETLWFRDEKPYITLRDHLFPQLIDEISQGQRRQVNIWSAACSTGQEPYSMVMMAKESGLKHALPNFDSKLSILASDISSSAVKIAQMARYDKIAMSRGMLPGMREKYFEENGMICSPKQEIRQPIRFKEFNLQQPFIGLGKFDIIMMRNVAIYFSKDFKQQLYYKLAEVLNPGGILFLGSSESMLGFDTPFVTKDFNRCIYYQLAGGRTDKV